MDIVSYAMGEGAGYSKGYSAGEASSTAYQDGYSAGYDAGEASSTAYQDGYSAGETDGYTSGYSEGYSAGYDAGEASVTPSAKKLLAARNASNLFATKIYSGNTSIDTGVPVLADGIIKEVITYDDFKDCTNINYLFRGQRLTKEFPTFNTSNVTEACYVFADCFEEVEHIGDGCTAPYLDLSHATSIDCMFEYEHQSGGFKNNYLKEIPLYNFSSVTSLRNLFKKCYSLEIIPAFNFSSVPESSLDFEIIGNNGCFANCFNLRRIHILDIHYNFDISASTEFTREALVEIISNLRDMTGSAAKTLTMGYDNWAKLTDDDFAWATDKNWNIA